MTPPPRIGTRGILLLAVASAIVTANAYYVHPIVGPVAKSFAVSDSLVGAVPALNQIALALGVLLLLPLGDRISNRRMVIVCLSAQVVALVAMATVQHFTLFVIASAALGFFTITPYLLPAYASKRVDPRQLGFVTAVLSTGVIAGVQLSRLSAGVIGEYLGWRTVYWIAACLMVLAAVVLPVLMRDDDIAGDEQRQSYWQLLRSLRTLARQYPNVMMSGVIQGLSFAVFLATWMGIGLHLTNAEMGLGTDTVGYLSAFSAIGLLLTPRLGKWADRLGAERMRVMVAFAQLLGVVLLAFASTKWWHLLFPIAVFCVFGPLIDITGRMTSLSQPAETRTRMMSLYITLMFIGGGMGSWGGTIAYDTAGWPGTISLVTGLSILVCVLSTREYRVRRKK